MAELHQNQGFIDNILENLKKVFRFLKELRKFASEIKKMKTIFRKSMMMMCPEAQRTGMD